MRTRQSPRWQQLTWLLFLLYIVILLKLVLFRVNTSQLMERLSASTDLARFSLRWQHSNFTPFATIRFYLSGAMSARIALDNLAGNIALFVPMGFLLPILWPRLRRLPSVLLWSFGISLGLEIIQLLTGLGQCDVDDLLLNVLGAAVGWLVYHVVAMIARKVVPPERLREGA